jgi:micrococcal nuclease
LVRKFVLALLVLATACSSSAGGSTTGPSASAVDSLGQVVRVVKVTDGDTIHVILEGRDERVRLIGMDTPEVDWYGGVAECFGEEAGRYTQRRLADASVRLGFDVDRRDQYGRLLAYVFVGQELFNLTLVEQGYARVDRVPPNTSKADAFDRAEDRARTLGRGVWSACPAPGS